MDADYLPDNNYGYDWSQYKWDPVTTTQYFNPVITRKICTLPQQLPQTVRTRLNISSSQYSGALGILVVSSRMIGYERSHHILFGPIQKPQTSQSSADTESNNGDTHDSPPAYSASNEIEAGSTANAEGNSKNESSSAPAYSGNGNASADKCPELSTTETPKASGSSSSSSPSLRSEKRSPYSGWFLVL
ncbi:hypothetical protein CBER1_08628 [Cercospora berteroae]|uniref:Uncharacterized protein n=1 Tax=Cercospora berteroae TaxID=357750 RepID=A0A2S6BV39_9PEZI|nr:hypothetical protein CBER1_08628 [Cercospora berteroae]